MQNFKKLALFIPLFFSISGCSTSDNQLISDDDDLVLRKAINKASWESEVCIRKDLEKKKISREDLTGSADYEVTFGKLGGVTDVELIENNISIPETEHCVRDALKKAKLEDINLGGFRGVTLKYRHHI